MRISWVRAAIAPKANLNSKRIEIYSKIIGNESIEIKELILE